MQRVIPAIIPTDLTMLEQTLELVRPFARDVQLDIVDGVFVNDTGWPYRDDDQIADVAELLTALNIEFDLMIKSPETVIDAWLALGPSRVVIHLESTHEFAGLVHKIRANGTEVGASILNDTPLTTLTSFIDMGSVDFVQLMGISDIGAQGQPFDPRVLVRAEELKQRYPLLPLSVDGSVNETTLPRLREVGVERFVSGSAILGADDPKAAFWSLEAIAAGVAGAVNRTEP